MPRRSTLRVALAGYALVACACAPVARGPTVTTPPPPRAAGDLLPPEAFASLADRDTRAKALFLEASRVLLHPRCVNCHPAGDAPHQRGAEPHEPPVSRGDDDRGPPAMRCGGCHQDTNVELARVPGAPDWRLAPRAMAWEGKTPADVCAQVKDPARNGGRSLERLVYHSAHDPLVAWGWSPVSPSQAGGPVAHDRPPAPGSQARFAALVAAWVEAGAACPEAEARP